MNSNLSGECMDIEDINWGFGSSYLIRLLLNTLLVWHSCAPVIRQCCLSGCSDMHMRDASQRWIVLVQLSVSKFHVSCRMQVFACVSECVHAVMVGLWGFDRERADRICAPWLHLSVQPPRGQEVSGICHICRACRDRPPRLPQLFSACTGGPYSVITTIKPVIDSLRNNWEMSGSDT